ncbi:MAG: endo-arabinase [Sphingobacteriaceae bacterium]|nr:MAG: endo-arabinase [Sphingobacteriaceae bacterium]
MRNLILNIFFACCFATSYGQTTDEKEAIKNVLKKEAATWRSGDIKGHAACWQIRPYSRILVSTADGAALDIPPEAMIHPTAGLIGQGGSAVQSNYKISISHDEESTTRAGQKSYSYEMRILEKIDGRWKIVGQSIHLYKPK